MFGCVGRIVSAIVLLVAGAALWHFRELWLPKAQRYLEDRVDELEVPEVKPPAVEVPKIGLWVAPGVRADFAAAGIA